MKPDGQGFKPLFLIIFFLFAAISLSAAMALYSAYDRNPDEFAHFLAAKYYTGHFLPPVIGDESVRNTYSVWGVSYLNYHWAEYFLAGKFAAISSIFLSGPAAVRFFNVFLFLAIAVFFIWKSRADSAILIIPAFIVATPQPWYVFSYVNNDAFALFVSFLLAYQLASEGSLLNRYLSSGGAGDGLKGGIWFGFLAGLLAVCKTNYVSFLLFAGLWLLFKYPLKDIITLKKYAVASLAALAFFGFRIGIDFYVNGETNFVGASYISYFSGSFETKKNKLLAYQEEVAEKPYKPSTIENELENTDRTLKLRAKGLKFKDLFNQWHWHNISFASFTGVYGYMDIWASEVYYRIMKYLYFLFGLYLCSIFLLSRNAVTIGRSFFTFSAAVFAVFISAYLSWAYAFQPQGRYLFPIIPMLGVLVYTERERFHKWAIIGFLSIAFLLSLYSFVFVGLARINGS